MRRALALLVLLLALAGTIGAVSVMRVEQIRVAGLETLSPGAVIEASGLRPGDRILWIRLSSAERGVERIPAVAGAVAERSLPSTVVIHVTEREPLVRLEGEEGSVADSTGRIFQTASDRPLPLLAGWTRSGESEPTLSRPSRVFLDAFARFGDPLRSGAARIELSLPARVWLHDGTEIRIGPLDDLEPKAAAANAVLAATEPGALAYVDVRSPTVPVSVPRPEPTEEESAKIGPSPAETPSEPA